MTRYPAFVAALAVGLTGIGVAACDRADGATSWPQVAHRGYGAPESTREAFVGATKAGFAGIEFDVRLTKDGRAVLVHDATLDRTTTCTGKVADITLEQLSRCSVVGGGKVPTLLSSMQLIQKQKSWRGVVFMHIKVDLNERAAAGVVKAARVLSNEESRVIMLLESPDGAAPLRKAGWDGKDEGRTHKPGISTGKLARSTDVERFGFMVHTNGDWSRAKFAQVVVTYGYGSRAQEASITPARAAAVRARGSLLLGIPGFPQSEAELRAAGADGVLV